jgi:ABC-type enterochelin transport system substrate-binding protein
MSDNDIENVMKNLKEVSKRFQSSFNSTISKSTIRKTSQEKDDKALVQSFRNQTEQMLKIFQDKHKADTTLPGVLSTAKQIDDVFASVHLGRSAASLWAKCKSELNILANQFNLPS